MKKIVGTAVAVAVLGLGIAAWAASGYVPSFSDGKYDGTITSVLPELNGQKTTLELKHVGNKVEATVTYEGGKEVWTWDDTTLDQKEINLKTNKVVLQYGATATGAPAGTKQTYTVNCKDKAANICDADVDSRNSWTLESAPNTVKYIVTGVPKDKKGDATAKPTKRHEFVFVKK